MRKGVDDHSCILVNAAAVSRAFLREKLRMLLRLLAFAVLLEFLIGDQGMIARLAVIAFGLDVCGV